MASDLLALLDTLDGLMVAMTPGPYCRAHHGAWELQARPNQRLADFGTIDHAADDAQAVQALLNAYPRLSAALRAVLTPADEGEREAREALGTAEHDIQHAAPAEAAQRTAGWGTPIRHLRHVLALLATERAKAADAARERAAIVAWLRGPCNDPFHDVRWCSTCESRSDYADAIARGAHTKETP